MLNGNAISDTKAHIANNDGTILRSPDIGNTSFSKVLLTNSVDLYGVAYLSSTDTFIIGDHSQMHLAVGGGQVQIPNVYLPSIADFDFTDPLNGCFNLC